MNSGSRARRSAAPDQLQLFLPLASLSEQDFLREMHARSASQIRQVRFKANRSRLISLSADRSRLNLHECFQSASAEVLDAIAVFATSVRDSASCRRAVQRMRAWHEANGAEAPEDSEAPNTPCCGTDEQRRFLQSLYRRLNHSHFGGVLPDVLPIRLSDRMKRRLGQVTYARVRKPRAVREIALNVDLMLERNEQALVDTLLHEMAHAEAWILHGHRAHGRVWRDVARRIGCEARACSAMRIRRRRKGTDLAQVPDVEAAIRRPVEPGGTSETGPPSPSR